MLVSKTSTVMLNTIYRNIKRFCSSSVELHPHAKYVYNRNPRNLEKLRIAYKPAGYHLDVPDREFWNK